MDRRQFLAVVGGVVLAGCGSDGGDGGDGAADGNGDPVVNYTVTVNTPGEFEIIDVESPRAVNVGEPHHVRFTVENVGEKKGYVQWELEWKFVDANEWESAELVGPELAPGDTGTIETFEPLQYERTGDVEFRVPAHEASWSYEVEEVGINVSIDSTSIVEVGIPSQEAPALLAQAAITNAGEDLTDTFDVTVDWFEGDGTHIGSSEVEVPPVSGGETVSPRFSPPPGVQDASDRIETIDVALGSIDPLYASQPADIVVENEQLLTETDDLTLQATLRNDGDDERGYLETFAKFEDDDGTVIGWDWTTVTDVPAGEAVQIEFDAATGGRDDDVTDYQLLVFDELVALD